MQSHETALIAQSTVRAVAFDIQGHRGCRGLMPENTIEAFRYALSMGVNTLELDVVISKDKKVIISHEPFMSHEICSSPDGIHLTKEDEEHHNIYRLDYEEIKKYDCGSRIHLRFPHQQKLKTFKPSLHDMVLEMEKISKNHLYNIEIKRTVEGDGIYHPGFDEFADLLVNELKDLEVLDRTTIQCFDIQTLRYLYENYPMVKLVYLIENNNSYASNMDTLGFRPHCYSPYYKLVDKELIDSCRTDSILVIPWTVNNENDIRDMLLLGVDGIITDYPDRLIATLEQVNNK